MYTRKGKMTVLWLLIALLALTVSACTKGNDNNAGSPAASNAQPSDAQSSNAQPSAPQPPLDKVSLNFYLMGDAPNDLDEVTAAINKKLLQDLNADIKFHFSTWTEWANKYNLMLASGEPMDAIYAANWLQYFNNTQKGAFIPLDELLPQYAPDVWALIPEDRWDGARVNGDIYAIPTATINYVQKGILYREDLRVKYDLPKVTDIATLEQYLAAVKADSPALIPLSEPDFMGAFFVATTPYQYIDSQDQYGPTMGLLVASPDNPSKLVSVFDLPEHKEMAKRMKHWADAGYVSKSILSFQGDPVLEFSAGNSVVYLSGHLNNASGIGLQMALDHPEWAIDWHPWNAINGLVHSSLPTQDLTAIPRNAKHPERALMVINKFMTDKSYYDLVRYGVLDLNYKVNAEGVLDTAEIPEEHRFSMSSWAWANEQLDLPSDSQWSGYKPLLASLKEQEVVNPFAGLSIDVTAVQSEAGALAQVYDQYVLPLHTGLVEDVDKAYETAIQRLNAAGFEKFKAEIQRQLDSYLAAE